MRTPVSLRKVYEAYRDEGEVGDLARTLLAQQDWFASVAEFDPRTSYALPLGLDEVLRRLASPTKTPYARDRLWRIVEHSRTSVERIFAALREDPRREQAVLPIRDVKELDAASFIALSRRPGRNIREKLAGKPYMQAVRRYQSVDLPENRLLKEYVTQLADFLELRATYLGHEDEILAEIYRWLRRDEAQAIGQWGNIPPNNTLLAHKDYRRVWDSWRALQTLDLSTDDDLKNLESRADTVAQWTQYANAHADGLAVFGDLPVLFDYDAFSITPWEGRPIVADARESPRKPRVRTPTVRSPVCVDLTTLHPRYSTDGATAAVMTESFVWQRWHGEHGVQDLDLFEADAAIVSPDATTLTWGDLTTVTDETSSDVIGAAALAFTRRLSATFMHPALITLVPDSTNDFQMETVRRHVNARFAQAEPLPRSIAAAIEQLDYSRIPRDGFQLVVVDTVGAVTSATKLTARRDPQLAIRVPQTRGFYWERAPHLILRSAAPSTSVLRQMLTVDDQELWRDALPPVPGESVGVGALSQATALGAFDHVITVAEGPVAGGMRLFRLQQAAGDIPLWRDQIPELAIKVLKDGLRLPFYLVSAYTTIRPLTGIAVQIPVTETFTLRADQPHYEFTLYQGDSASDLGYEAILKSPSFPLHTDTECALDLTYTYGADDPYRLRFVPIDRSFPPVTATWRPMSERPPVDLDSLPIPPFPAPPSWDELQHWPRPQPDPISGATESDLLEWITTALESLNPQKVQERRAVRSMLRRVLADRVVGSFQFGKYDKNNRYFCYVEVDGERIWCHESNFVEHVDHSSMRPGDTVYLSVDRTRDHPSGRYVSYSSRNPSGLEDAIRRSRKRPAKTPAYDFTLAQKSLFSARFPTYTVWRHGRSTRDAQCPDPFRQAVVAGVGDAVRLLREDATPADLKDELFFLLCRLHVDSPESVQQRLVHIVENDGITCALEAPIAYSIGACSQNWQQRLFRRILECSYEGKFWMLSVALWRSPEPVAYLTLSHMRTLLPTLCARMKDHVTAIGNGESVHKLTVDLEVLLALLRTRESPDPEMKAPLSPDSAYGRLFTEQLDTITNKLADAGRGLSSRVDLQVDKPPEFSRIPDLLYALRLYLTGDAGASAVRITGVTDE